MDCGPNGDSFVAPRMLPDPDEEGDYRWPPSCMTPLEDVKDTTNPAVAHPIRIRTTPSLWCSSPCPAGQKPLFAIGTSNGLYTLEGAGSYWSLSEKLFPSDIPTGRPVPPRKMDSSHALVASVEWLSPNVIASGLKDSSIFVHDLRSGGSATRLQHSHAVAKIRSVDPYRIVVGGINSVF